MVVFAFKAGKRETTFVPRRNIGLRKRDFYFFYTKKSFFFQGYQEKIPLWPAEGVNGRSRRRSQVARQREPRFEEEESACLVGSFPPPPPHSYPRPNFCFFFLRDSSSSFFEEEEKRLCYITGRLRINRGIFSTPDCSCSKRN